MDGAAPARPLHQRDRDVSRPVVLSAFREKVFRLLRTYPFTRIWAAGCSTGEEVYSLAILLQEEQIYDRTRIYATDINESVLEQAQSGRVPARKMREYTQNYIKAGGTRAFSEYYVAKYDGAQFQRSLIENVVFAQHNLVSDRSFNEFNVIICRNVMIYFDHALQDRVHRLFFESARDVRHARARAKGIDPLQPARKETTKSRSQRKALPKDQTRHVTTYCRIGAVGRTRTRSGACSATPAGARPSHRRSHSIATATSAEMLAELLGAKARRPVLDARTRSRSRPGTSTSRRRTTTCWWNEARSRFPSTRTSSSRVRRSTCCSRRPPTRTGRADRDHPHRGECRRR